jgi:tripartite-type tricarboxylate transporter receptor subunit TctC
LKSIFKTVISCILLMSAMGVWAQSSVRAVANYPNKPVKVVVPYPPGGPTDIVARVVFQQVSLSTGQQFVIENRAGAGGNIGADAVARSPADGYTLLVATTAHAINMSLFKNISYDVQRDFDPVSLLTRGPLVLVANPDFPANNIVELIALAKRKPGTLSFASSGNGQSTHLAAELFNSMAGISMTHIPYKGSAPALTDVMSGQVNLMFDTTLSAMPLVMAGKLKALGVTSVARTNAAPNTPTIGESGLLGFEVFAWNGLLAPTGTPKAVIAVLNEELRKALQITQIREKFNAQGFTASANSPEQFGSFLQQEIVKWSATVKSSGATLN